MSESRPAAAGRRRARHGAACPQGLAAALHACRASFLYAGFFSLFVNLLLLLPAIYMLQIYDRVLTSGSESTLAMLTLGALFLFMTMGGLEWVRSQILVATSNRLDHLLAPRVFDTVFARTRESGGRVASSQPLGDLLQLRQFLTGPGLFAFFDAPWLPIYIAVMFMFHPAIGVTALLSALLLAVLAVWNEFSTRGDLDEANRKATESSQQVQRELRNADAIEAMGMLPRLRERWWGRQLEMLALQARASRRGGLITSVSKTYRIAIQTLILGLGAWLAIRREISPGAVIAGSILLGRALAPLDLMINTWRGFVSARGAYGRLDQLLLRQPPARTPMPLPVPTGALSAADLVATPPGAAAPVLQGVNLQIDAGTQLAVIGPSAAGKTTLLRALIGLCPAASGSVRLDGAEIDQWDREALGAHVGYLPQDVELLDGSVGENIARFGVVDAEQVVAAAQAAGVHEMILRLPQGYDTVIAGNALSAGQRQRIGLARALYGDPPLLLLDEPNANLDQEGEGALVRALRDLKQRRRTVVFVTHRRGIVRLADHVLLLVDGQVAAFGPTAKVLAGIERAAQPTEAKVTQVAPAAAQEAAIRPVIVSLHPAAGGSARGE